VATEVDVQAVVDAAQAVQVAEVADTKV